MYLADGQASSAAKCRRKEPRFNIQCRVRIRIGNRHYAGYIHNISRGGARLRTISPIRKFGPVVLTLPDLPALRCELRWTDAYNAGVAFERALASAAFSKWATARSRIQRDGIGEAGEVVWEKADL